MDSPTNTQQTPQPMSKKPDISAGFHEAIRQGKEQAKTDRRLSQQAHAGRAVALLDFAQVRPREEDTRPARAPHILALAESIAAAGLVQPPAVDRAHRLVAGLHRIMACQLLLLPVRDRKVFAEGLDQWDEELTPRLEALPDPRHLPEPLNAGKVPVRVLADLDAEKDPASALAAEAAENTARRQYTPQEIRDLAQRLRKAGYREVVGRPKKGEKALRPALELVLGKSADTVRRILGKKATGTKDTPEAKLERLRKACLAVADIALPAKTNLPALRGVLAAAQEMARAIPDAREEAFSL
jgi:ParB family transcriptional regulator, chromosome partitioning protein